MKKLSLLFACLFSIVVSVYAADDKPIQVNQLPQAAQLFIKNHFPTAKVAFAKMDSGFFDKSYDVIFTNGDKLEFNKKGEWTEMNCRTSGVPAKAVPARIQQYVSENYPDSKILKIEKDDHDYEVKLSNRQEIKFDLNFNVIDLDND